MKSRVFETKGCLFSRFHHFSIFLLDKPVQNGSLLKKNKVLLQEIITFHDNFVSYIFWFSKHKHANLYYFFYLFQVSEILIF